MMIIFVPLKYFDAVIAEKRGNKKDCLIYGSIYLSLNLFQGVDSIKCRMSFLAFIAMAVSTNPLIQPNIFIL